MVNDKSQYCIPFILNHVTSHRHGYLETGETPPPFFVGVNGVQGAGKTTLVNDLRQSLKLLDERLLILVLSIDDLYLTNDMQNKLARTHRDNPLVQHRGQPSTHDVDLGKELFDRLSRRERNVKIPIYDKSAHGGKGDRRPQAEWTVVNRECEATIDVVIFEGWCVAFRPLSESDLRDKWWAAKTAYQNDSVGYQGQLGRLEFEHVRFINSALQGYDVLTNRLQALIHLDADNTKYVYTWRLQQETEMRKAKGTGMTDEQVFEFVNGYYPAYELYSDVLRSGVFEKTSGMQLRLTLAEDRRVRTMEVI